MTDKQKEQIIAAIEYAKDQYEMSCGEINWCDVESIFDFDDLITAVEQQ